MSKANEKALDWLPKRKDGREKCYRCNDDDIRSIYARGYRKAEKDLELGWEDIKTVIEIADKLVSDNVNELIDNGEEWYYKEALKRYKKLKDVKQEV